MRKLLLLALGAALVWRFVTRRQGVTPTVTIGWADGSSLVLDADAVDRDRLVIIAERAINA